MDWWLAGFVYLCLFILVAGIPAILAQAGGTWPGIVIALFLFFCAIVLIDGSFFTMYRLEEGGLVITTQLRHFSVPYRSMVRIKTTGFLGLFSVPFPRRRSFSLSSHGYVITLEGEQWGAVTISPSTPDGFINELLERIDRERSERATVVRTD